MNYPDPTSLPWCYPDNAGDYYYNNRNIAEDYNNNVADLFGDYTMYVCYTFSIFFFVVVIKFFIYI
jgi:hypothetical protein